MCLSALTVKIHRSSPWFEIPMLRTHACAVAAKICRRDLRSPSIQKRPPFGGPDASEKAIREGPMCLTPMSRSTPTARRHEAPTGARKWPAAAPPSAPVLVGEGDARTEAARFSKSLKEKNGRKFGTGPIYWFWGEEGDHIVNDTAAERLNDFR